MTHEEMQKLATPEKEPASPDTPEKAPEPQSEPECCQSAQALEIDAIARRFTYHPPKGSQPERYESLRASARMIASLIVACCPDSRERSTALTKLEEAVMWANASIARNE